MSTGLLLRGRPLVCERLNADRATRHHGRSRVATGATKRQMILIPSIVAAQAAMPSIAAAEEVMAQPGTCKLTLSVDGKPFGGQVAIELFDPETTGSQRFLDLCVGREGVSYRRSKFDALYAVRSCWCAAVPPSMASFAMHSTCSMSARLQVSSTLHTCHWLLYLPALEPAIS
jgi:hypothetical protein